MDQKLTVKQQRFVDEYMVDHNATQAAIRAGYSAKTANAAAPRLLVNVGVQAAIQKALQKQQKRTEITADWTLKEIYKLAKFNSKSLYNPDGSIIPIHKLDDDTAACIGSIEIAETPAGERTKKVKVWDKGQALDKLARHFKLYDDPASGGASAPPVINIYLSSDKIQDGIKNNG